LVSERTPLVQSATHNSTELTPGDISRDIKLLENGKAPI
jgi:hypothetical protein